MEKGQVDDIHFFWLTKLMQHRFFHSLFRVLFPQQHPSDIKKRYHLPEALNLHIKLGTNGWFIVTSPDLPGLVTQAKSQEELIEMVNDAVLTYFDVPKRAADIVYNQLNLGNQLIEYKGKLATKTA